MEDESWPAVLQSTGSTRGSGSAISIDGGRGVDDVAESQAGVTMSVTAGDGVVGEAGDAVGGRGVTDAETAAAMTGDNESRKC